MTDKLFGIHAQAIALRARRAELIASNLANSDTPQYKAKDIDFKAALSDAMKASPSAMVRTASNHLRANATALGTEFDINYRVPHQPSLDGNTVDEQIEKGEFATNAVRYMASLQFLEKRVQGLIRVLREE